LAQKRIAALLALYPKAPVELHGYVHNMPELLAGADCVVCKAGASLVMEALALHKPLIVSTYIHGQEKGNVRFIVDRGAGWFIQRPKAIWRKIAALAAAPDTLRATVRRIEELNIRPDTDALARYLLS
jgi:processive 1,2-diacylglycerol beta-glucosyltransferase/1,2-diacylglycerol 3-beta-galactosyltransferase